MSVCLCAFVFGVCVVVVVCVCVCVCACVRVYVVLDFEYTIHFYAVLKHVWSDLKMVVAVEFLTNAYVGWYRFRIQRLAIFQTTI